MAGMLKNRRLARAIADVGLHKLKTYLEHKAQWYARETRVIDRWFPSTKTCSAC
nr:zinc ribbon domain-containing protein [Methylomarinum sp. Ch1-1]MDP4523263.1 zinc ribbon domain-containing protein [Methylomarinum sp. Ch1-1]